MQSFSEWEELKLEPSEQGTYYFAIEIQPLFEALLVNSILHQVWSIQPYEIISRYSVFCIFTFQRFLQWLRFTALNYQTKIFYDFVKYSGSFKILYCLNTLENVPLLLICIKKLTLHSFRKIHQFFLCILLKIL